MLGFPHMHGTRSVNTTSSPLSRASGIALIVGALLTMFFMLHHPSTSSDQLGAALAEIRDEGMLSAWVHGMLMALMVCIWFGTHGLTRALGADRALPILGFMLFSLGTLAYCVAAMVSGFIVPWIGAGFAGSEPETMEQARSLLRLSGVTNQAFANAGLIGTSAGILLWSLSLLARRSSARWLGAAGIAVAAVPAVLLLTGQLRLHVTGMTIVVFADGAWYLLAGWLLLRGRLSAAR